MGTIKKLWGILMLVATSALGADVTISQLPSTNSVGDTHVVAVELVSGGVTNTLQTTIANLRASIATLGGLVTSSITNGFATLATVNNASNVVVTYAEGLTNGFVGAGITNGFATLQALATASNVVISYVNTATNGFVGTSVTNGFATLQTVNNASNVLVSLITEGSATNAIANQNGKGTNTTLYGTVLVSSAEEPTMTISAHVSDIDHLRIQTTNGTRYFTADSAGQVGRINLYTNDVAKVVLSAGSDSYLIGGMLGLGTNMPNHALDVHGAIRTAYAVPSSAAVISPDKTITNALANIDEVNFLVGLTGHVQTNINNRVTASELMSATNAIDFLLRGPPTELVSVPNTVLDWADGLRRYIDLTNDVNMTFLNTNAIQGTFLRVRAIGTNRALTLPDFDIYFGGVMPPSIINTNEVWGFQFGRSGGLMTIGVVSPTVLGSIIVQSNAVDKGTAARLNFVAGSGATVDVVNTDGTNTVTIGATGGGSATNAIGNLNGQGTNTTFRATTTNDALRVLTAAAALGFYFNSNAVPHVANGVDEFYFDGTGGQFFAGAQGMLTLNSVDNAVEVDSGTFLINEAVRLAATGSTLTVSNSNNTALGTVVANINPGTTGNIQFGASGPKLQASGTGLASIASDGFSSAPITGSRITTAATDGLRLGSSGPMITGSGTDTIRTSNSVATANANLVTAGLTNTGGVTVGGAISFTKINLTATAATNFIPNFDQGECELASSAITNVINIPHTTNWPSGRVGFCGWGIYTGITNRHLNLQATTLTNHIYGTNHLVPVSSFLLASNSFYRIPFESRTGAAAGVYMGFPIRSAP